MRSWIKSNKIILAPLFFFLYQPFNKTWQYEWQMQMFTPYS